MKISKNCLTVIFIFLSLLLQAQTDSTKIHVYTQSLAFNEDFSGAIRMYKQMITFSPESPVFYYKLGFAYLNTYGKSDSAIYYLRLADKYYSDKYKADVNKFEIDFYLARAYSLHKNIDSSLIILEKLRMNETDPQIVELLTKEIDNTKKNIGDLFDVKDLDTTINSSFTEHSPVYFPSQNMLVFTSRRKHPNGTLMDDGQYDEDIFISYWKNNTWSEPLAVKEFDTPYNEATTSADIKNNTLLLYKDEHNGDIYQSKYKNGTWTPPVPLPAPINTRHRETHASLTEDGKTIFFASDRPGGYGGMDIWMSQLQEDGTWSKPVNLGDAVNTKGDEDSPNISPDGKTLYFSSNGLQGYGGFDIYKSEKTQFGTWSKAQNLGYPINSVGDDIFFTLLPHTNKAFYTSYRYESRGAGDIFIVYLDSTELPDTPIINYGYVFDNSGNPIKDIEIKIFNPDTKQTAIARTSEKGKFIFVTQKNNKYIISIQGNNKELFRDTLTASVATKNIVFYKKIYLSTL